MEKVLSPADSNDDSSIVEKAASSKSFSTCFFRSLRPAVTRPHVFLVSRPFLLVLSLYFGTYLTANTIDSLTSMVKDEPAATVSSTTPKFLATSSVNMSLCVYKDSWYAQLFGRGGPAKSIPRLSYALFAARDSLTIFASFNLPPLLAPLLQLSPSTSSSVQTHIQKFLSTPTQCANAAQFLAPAAMQIFSTPIHLLGLDLYNRQSPEGPGWRDRLIRVRRDWTISALARMGRIVPAFGVGGVVNSSVRRRLMVEIE